MRSFKPRAVVPWITPVLIAGTLFGLGYTLGTWSDQGRWQWLATQTQELHQQVAQIRAEQEAWQAMRPRVVYATAGLYYHANTNGTITMHDDGTWGAHQNITHNLGYMARAAGIYEYLWRPDEIGVTQAYQLIEPVWRGLDRLQSTPDIYRAFNPANGWGTYEGLVAFVETYLQACETYPEAAVSVWR